jgi:putative two-component system response regulator
MQNKPIILVVDDEPKNIELIRAHLMPQGYQVIDAIDGVDALDKVKQFAPDLILLDVIMPKRDGFEVCRILKASPDTLFIPIVIVTALSELEYRIKGIEAGADDFLSKPINAQELISRVKSLLRIKTQHDEIERKTRELTNIQDQSFDKLLGLNKLLDETVRQKTASLTVEIEKVKKMGNELKLSLELTQSALTGIVHTLASTVGIRDSYTAGHQLRVANLARAIAVEMGLVQKEIEGIYLAGTIHDLGKMAVPSDILSKPGKLSKTEFEVIKIHPGAGYDVLKTVSFPWPIANIVRQHHERIDGSGYPDGVVGKDILIEARILSVADVVEAMAAHRPYRAALGIDKALEEITKNRGILYDATAVDVCVKLFKEKGFKFDNTEEAAR